MALRNHVQAGLAYFALVFATGFVLGSVRVTQVVPRLGERRAELIEMPLMLLACVLAARWVVTRFAVDPRPGPRAIMGIVALGCLLVAEFAVAFFASGGSVRDYIAHRDPVSGSVYLVVLVLFAAMPAILARWHRSR